MLVKPDMKMQDRKIGQEDMDQLSLKSFMMAETMFKADHLIQSNDGDGSVAVTGQREGGPSPYISELNQNYSRRFRRREQDSIYGEE
jgi:hypothetical protein